MLLETLLWEGIIKHDLITKGFMQKILGTLTLNKDLGTSPPPPGIFVICNINSFCFSDIGIPPVLFYGGELGVVLPSVYTVRSYTICNSRGWRDDTAKVVGNTEKQRTGGWAILLGEVTSVKLCHVADCYWLFCFWTPIISTKILKQTRKKFHRDAWVSLSSSYLVQLKDGSRMEKGKQMFGAKGLFISQHEPSLVVWPRFNNTSSLDCEYHILKREAHSDSEGSWGLVKMEQCFRVWDFAPVALVLW